VLEDGAVEFRLFPDAGRDPGQYEPGGKPHIDTIKVVGNFQPLLGAAPWDRAAAPALTATRHPASA
jgi:hypothetical protein